MGKGIIGTQTNVIVKTPKREKIKCACKKCMNYRRNVCFLGKRLYPSKCKWFATLDDYNLTNEEKKEIKVKNNISKYELHKKGNYNQGFGDMKVETVDLSKYK